jgi:hypothetical protein
VQEFDEQPDGSHEVGVIGWVDYRETVGLPLFPPIGRAPATLTLSARGSRTPRWMRQRMRTTPGLESAALRLPPSGRRDNPWYPPR